MDEEEIDFENVIRVNYLTQGVTGASIFLIAAYYRHENKIKELIREKLMIFKD